jgi:hypothetical protein
MTIQALLRPVPGLGRVLSTLFFITGGQLCARIKGFAWFKLNYPMTLGISFNIMAPQRSQRPLVHGSCARSLPLPGDAVRGRIHTTALTWHVSCLVSISFVSTSHKGNLVFCHLLWGARSPVRLRAPLWRHHLYTLISPISCLTWAGLGAGATNTLYQATSVQHLGGPASCGWVLVGFTWLWAPKGKRGMTHDTWSCVHWKPYWVEL